MSRGTAEYTYAVYAHEDGNIIHALLYLNVQTKLINLERNILCDSKRQNPHNEVFCSLLLIRE